MALIVREKHVSALLSMRDTVRVLEKAFDALAAGKAINQPRSRMVFSHGVLNILSAAAPTFGVFGFKAYTAFREGMHFVVLLFNIRDGQLLAMIEADRLGAMRTGGTSALATKYLARQDAERVGLIGAGYQAVTQLLGVCAVRSITSVHVYSRRPLEREIFCAEMERLLDVPVYPVDTAKQAVEVADILITATTASEPVIHGEWLRPGCHINAIGSNWPQKREIDSATLQRCAFIVTDSIKQAEMEAGDLIIPVNERQCDWEQVYELANVVSGEGPMRESPDEITLYKGLGIALEDVVTAAHVYQLACEQGIGEEVDFLS